MRLSLFLFNILIIESCTIEIQAFSKAPGCAHHQFAPTHLSGFPSYFITPPLHKEIFSLSHEWRHLKNQSKPYRKKL
jgi:hypothetical protein